MKPRVGVFGLSGCWGEQIVILNCEDELLRLFGRLDLVDFLGASSRNDREGPLDLALVEGSVSTAREEAELARIRQRARVLVACGTCACFGGVSAMAHPSSRAELAARVYGPGAPYDLRPHRPLADFVPVDASLPGCPMEKQELLQAVACLLQGDPPLALEQPVCAACRLREHECLLTGRGLPCAGAVTDGGCGARCPGYGVPCIGCRGPAVEANTGSLAAILEQAGTAPEDVRARLGTFIAPADRPPAPGGRP